MPVANAWPRSCRIALTLVAALAGAAALCGCNYVGAGYLLIKGPPKQPALYALDGTRATIIFLDDRANGLPRKSLGPIIAESAERALLDTGLFKPDLLLSSRGATVAANQERFDKPLSIVEIGREVRKAQELENAPADQRAQVIVWVTVDAFALSPDGVSYLPAGIVRIKVLDIASGERLWPEDPTGKSVNITMFQQQGTLPTDRSEAMKAEEVLARELGIGLAQVFHEHLVTESRLR